MRAVLRSLPRSVTDACRAVLRSLPVGTMRPLIGGVVITCLLAIAFVFGWLPNGSAQAMTAAPVLSVRQDRWHVDARLPGVKTFTFVVRTEGLADSYVSDVTPPFAIDRAKFGGRSVSVSAQASPPRSAKSRSWPWAAPQTVYVPVLKLFGISNPSGRTGAPAADERQLGISLNRQEFGYGESISSMDAKIANNTSHGVTPLVLLGQTSASVQGVVLPISQFDVEKWKTWASTVVARYGPGGTFWQGRGDARYAPTWFEVLNEPYGYWFYTPPDPAAYAKFFVAVVTAAKKANPKAKFLLAGSPVTFATTANVLSSKSWDAMLKSSPDGAAAQQLADGVTVHPYGSMTDARGWASTVTTHDDFPQLPVWITEIGYRMGETIDGVTVTPATQASLMQRTLNDYIKWPWAQAYVWFTWFDYDDARTGAHNWYGLVEADGTHRPAYDTYQRFIQANSAEPRMGTGGSSVTGP